VTNWKINKEWYSTVSINLPEIGCEAKTLMKVAESRVRGPIWFLSALKLRVQLQNVEQLIRSILGKQSVSLGGGWNWLRIVSNGGLWY
jgi:hypothetical protein